MKDPDDPGTQDWLEEIMRDAKSIPAPEKLNSLAVLANKQLAIEHLIETIEKELAQAKKELQQVSEHEIPDMMHELGVREFKLTDGQKISIKPFYSGKADSIEALKWLEDNGHATLIKRQVNVALDRTEAQLHEELIGFLRMVGINYIEKTGVHHQTMAAFIREQIEEGKPLDRELLQVYTGFRTTIK